MSELRKPSLRIANKTFPSRKIARNLGITKDSWIDLGFAISDAIHKRNKTPQEVYLALIEEVSIDAQEHTEHTPFSEGLIKQLGLLSIGISNLKYPKISIDDIQTFNPNNLTRKLTT